MIEKELICKNSYGGEVSYLKATDPYSIPAVRVFVSTHISSKRIFDRKMESTEDVIEYFSQHPDRAKKYISYITNFGHGDMGEWGYTGFYFKNFSRFFTFYSWMPVRPWEKIYLVGTEMSLRYVVIEENPFIKIGDNEVKKVNEKAFKLYKKMVENDVPKQDARYVMPLATKTEEIIQIPEGRMLEKFANYLYYNPLREINETGRMLKDFVKSLGYSYPIEEAPNGMMLKKNKNIEREMLEKNLRKYGKMQLAFFYPFSVAWKAKGSIASYHQDVRNRQVVHYWPSWEEVIYSNSFVYPETAKDFHGEIEQVYDKQLEISKRFWQREDYDNALYVLPLGKEMEVTSFVSGIEHIKDVTKLRTCLRAQWEIRSRYNTVKGFLKRISKELNIEEFSNLGPSCIVDNVCYEYKKENCPMYKKIFGG
jgi:thymidylate synthase ThyX